MTLGSLVASQELALGCKEGGLGSVYFLGCTLSILHLGPVAWEGCLILGEGLGMANGGLGAGVPPSLHGHLAILG